MRTKPVSVAQIALDSKAPLNSPTFTGTGIDKTMVDLEMLTIQAMRTNQFQAAQTALDLKAI
jgi:hypothetical protein